MCPRQYCGYTGALFCAGYPYNSVVNARIIKILDGDGSINWVLTIQLSASKDVSGKANLTSSLIGQQLITRTMDDTSRLKNGRVITAHLRFEGDQTGSFYYIWHMH